MNARVLAIVLLSVAGVSGLAHAQPGAPREVSPANRLPAELADIGVDQRLGEQIPLEATFRDETGRQVELAEYFQQGKPVVLALAYYDCPMLCTQVLNGLVSALRVVTFEPAKDFTVLTISFNPRETPELARAKKQSYVERYDRPGAAEGWHFLTGDEAAIRRVTRAVGFRYAYDERIGQYIHATAIMVLTPGGKLARYFYGIEYSPKDLRFGLVEASGDRVGTPVDQILLFCYHYDPAKGRYSLVMLNLVRAGGVLTVLALGTFMIVMLRRERKNHRG